MKKHRNILYGIVFILLVLQFMSFLSFTSQVSKVSSDLEAAKSSLENTINSYNALYQESFQEITMMVSEQKESFNQEIKLLKSSSGDFTGVINDAVKSVVSVGTDKSAGSGFIISQEGYIVTNNHVIEGASDVRVLTYGGEIITAEIIGGDLVRDIALIKISAGDYRSLKLADSDNLRVGEKVIAIGNPLGLSFTVTEGIISAVHREGPNGFPIYVQTDVSLNPGNSGGPLINTEGDIVGINNFKIGDSEGLGFALESNSIAEIVNLILEAAAQQ